MRKIIFITTGLILLGLYACQKYEDPKITDTSTYPLSGEWWVRLMDEGGNVLVDYVPFLTYNTSSNKGDSMWVDDEGNTWQFKVKAACDVKNKTFKTDSTVSVYPGYNIKVDIKDGTVILKGAKTKTGNVTDSIYMKIGFEDDPGTVYIIAGFRRTGFKADDY